MRAWVAARWRIRSSIGVFGGGSPLRWSSVGLERGDRVVMHEAVADERAAAAEGVAAVQVGESSACFFDHQFDRGVVPRSAAGTGGDVAVASASTDRPAVPAPHTARTGEVGGIATMLSIAIHWGRAVPVARRWAVVSAA
jgi:hypothetical protein